MEKEIKKEKNKSFLWWGSLVIYGVLCLYLFYMQSIQPLDYDNRYFQSDLPYHISMIIDDGWYYSFTAYVYQVLHFLCGGGTALIALFLAVVTVLCVILTEELLKHIMKQEVSNAVTMFGAFALNFVMPFYLTLAGHYPYVSYQSGNLWHNSTYQCMKLVALACILCYERLQDHYKERITAKEWLTMAVLLFICTGIKPSFLTVFAPVLAVKLLIDLIKKVPFKQIFLLGSTVLPACGIVLWQSVILFGSETGNGTTFDPWYTFSLHADRPKVAVICSVAFPVVVLLFSIKELWKDKRYFFVWSMAGVGFLEALCLVETGTRSRDGNFVWGYAFAIFLLMIYSFEKWWALGKKLEESLYARIAFGTGGVVLAYQLYCGIRFFMKLMQGTTYFMYGL